MTNKRKTFLSVFMDNKKKQKKQRSKSASKKNKKNQFNLK